jgi:hypothetical protein
MDRMGRAAAPAIRPAGHAAVAWKGMSLERPGPDTMAWARTGKVYQLIIEIFRMEFSSFIL